MYVPLIESYRDLHTTSREKKLGQVALAALGRSAQLVPFCFLDVEEVRPLFTAPTVR